MAAVLNAHMAQHQVSTWQGVCPVPPKAEVTVAQQLALCMGTCGMQEAQGGPFSQ